MRSKNGAEHLYMQIWQYQPAHRHLKYFYFHINDIPLKLLPLNIKSWQKKKYAAAGA